MEALSALIMPVVFLFIIGWWTFSLGIPRRVFALTTSILLAYLFQIAFRVFVVLVLLPFRLMSLLGGRPSHRPRYWHRRPKNPG